MTKRRKAPMSPETIALRAAQRRAEERAAVKDPASWGVCVDRTLPAHAETEIRRDAKGRATAAWRSSVIAALSRAGALNQGQVNAAEDFAKLWAQWKGLEGRPEVVGKPTDGGARDLLTDRMIHGGRAVEGVLAGLGPLSRRLLKAFMVAMVEEDRPMSWRGVVERETGEAREKEQRAMAVFAFEELRLVTEGRIAA
jgi:hypothetical protein